VIALIIIAVLWAFVVGLDVVRVHFLTWRFKRQLQRRYPGAKITIRVQVVDGSNEPKFTITVLPK